MRRLARGKAVFPLKARAPAPVRRTLIAATLGFALTACSVVTPASITSTTGQLPQGQPLQLAPFPQDESLRGKFGQVLAEHMAAQSIILADDAPLIAEFAIGARGASAGLADPSTSTQDDVVWESPPRGRGKFDNCDARRLRATLILLNRAEGTVRYRGTAESNICDYGDQELADLAAVLINDASGALPSD